MGSSGQRRRKGNKKPQHLAKVGTKSRTSGQAHAEREAIAANLGLGNTPAWVKYGLMLVVVVAVAGAIIGLLLLTVFH